MPRVDIGKYEIRIYAADLNERPHVHIWNAGRHAKYWIDRIEFFSSQGYASHELTAIERMLHNNHTKLMHEWNKAKARK